MINTTDKQKVVVASLVGLLLLSVQSTAYAGTEVGFWGNLGCASLAVGGIGAWEFLYYAFIALGICFYGYIIVNLILRRIPVEEKPAEGEEPKPSAYRNCPHCGVLIPVDAPGCDYCGVSFGTEPVYHCSVCKKIYPRKQERCSACGAPVWQLEGVPMREKPKVKPDVELPPTRGLPIPKVSIILGTTAIYFSVIIAVTFFSTVYRLGTEDVQILRKRKSNYPGMRQLEQLAGETPAPPQQALQDLARIQEALAKKRAAQQPTTPEQASQLLEQLQASQFQQEAQIRTLILGLGDTAIPALENALKSREPRMRQFAIPILAELDAAQTVPALIENARHGDPATRGSAIDALGKLGKIAAIPSMIRALGDGNVELRRSAASALGELHAMEAIPSLIPALGDSDPKVSELAWLSLQHICAEDLPQDSAVWITWWTIHQIQTDLSPERRIAALRDKLHDADPWVRAFAALELSHYRDLEIVGDLAALLTDQEPQVRGYAHRALAEVTGADFGTDDRKWTAWGIFCQGESGRGHAALEKIRAVSREQDQSDVIANAVPLGELAIPALSYLVTEGNKYEQYHAAVVLAQIHHPTIVEPLQVALDDERELLRQTILEKLMPYKDPAVKPLFLRALTDASPAVQERAAACLGKLHDYSAVPELLERLQNTEAPVEERHMAAGLLGNIGDPSSVPVLLQLLEEEIPLRSNIVEALGSMKAREAVPALMRVMQAASGQQDFALMAKTVTALGMIGDASALEPVMDALKTSDSDVHAAVIQAIGAIGDPAGVPVLVKELEGLWWESAAHALGNIDGQGAVDALSRLLESDDAEHSRVALDALAQSHDRSAVQPIIAHCKKAPATAQVHAITALGEIKNPLCVPFLITRLDASVQTAAQQAIRDVGASAIPVLIESLNTTDDTIRGQLILLLGDLGDPIAIPALLRQLNAHGEHASKALAAIGPAAVPELIQALANTDDATPRYYIIQGLAHITAHDLGTDHAKWQRWWEENAGRKH